MMTFTVRLESEKKGANVDNRNGEEESIESATSGDGSYVTGRSTTRSNNDNDDQ